MTDRCDRMLLRTTFVDGN